MSVYETIKEVDDRSLFQILEQTSAEEVDAIVGQEKGDEKIDEKGFLKLLSSAASSCSLESMALRSRQESLKHFGKAILLYSPIYIANHCVNRCIYCNFNHKNRIERSALTVEEIRREGEAVRERGIQHILLLTGESRTHSSVEYIKEAIEVLRPLFPSNTLEVYPMEESEYGQLVKAGADGVTIYQETYDEMVYERVHLAGPKKNYRFRLDAPERALRGGVRTIGLGALLGLADWRADVFRLGLHAKYLAERFPAAEIGLSLPRIKSIETTESATVESSAISDRDFVQILCALRLFLPFCSISISTRESADFRKKLIPIGINKISAGVSTEVGGYATKKNSSSQFDIADHSSVEAVKSMIEQMGYQPVMRDWMDLDGE